jgi:hypothetical protein
VKTDFLTEDNQENEVGDIGDRQWLASVLIDKVSGRGTILLRQGFGGPGVESRGWSPGVSGVMRISVLHALCMERK